MVYLFVFDLDGTLIDSKGIHAKAFLETVKKYFGKNVDEERTIKIIKENFGRPGRYISKLLIDTFGLKITPNEFMKKKAEVFSGMLNKLKLFPCVKELLSYLKSRNQLLVIASYSKIDEVRMILNNFKIRRYFDLIYGFDESSNVTKEEFVSKLRIFLKDNVEKFFIIDDFHEILIKARGYGYIPIGILTGKSSREDFIRNDIKFFENLCELREYLKNVIE